MFKPNFRYHRGIYLKGLIKITKISKAHLPGPPENEGYPLESEARMFRNHSVVEENFQPLTKPEYSSP